MASGPIMIKEGASDDTADAEHEGKEPRQPQEPSGGNRGLRLGRWVERGGHDQVCRGAA